MAALCILSFLALAALATAGDEMTYNGKFPGKCGDDGLYYQDTEQFVICSNGEATTQKCAAGSANHDYFFYNFGRAYDRNHFCSINLLARGHNYGQGYGQGYNPGFVQGYGPGYGQGYGQGYGYPYGYQQRFYGGNNYYGYQPYGYYPMAYPFPYFYPMGYPYGQPYGAGRAQGENKEHKAQ